MRGVELLSPSHSSMLLADPELAELSVQINQRWPSLPEPLPLAWTEPPWSRSIAAAFLGSSDRPSTIHCELRDAPSSHTNSAPN
jgi:hypothetical protein